MKCEVASTWILAPRYVFIALIRAYQAALSPWLGPRCRFFPSCSAYACEALATHGVWRGGKLMLWRLARCHPWHRGGVDFVPGVTCPHGGHALAERSCK